MNIVNKILLPAILVALSFSAWFEFQADNMNAFYSNLTAIAGWACYFSLLNEKQKEPVTKNCCGGSCNCKTDY